MNRRLLATTLVLFALGVAVPSADAQAQIGPGIFPGQLYGFGGFSANNMDYVPYFAAHPPVYYSRPVPRTYGYSPYAYPPSVMTPDVKWVAPEVMLNPFYESGRFPMAPSPAPAEAAQGPKTGDRVAQAPLRINNPFYRARQLSDSR